MPDERHARFGEDLGAAGQAQSAHRPTPEQLRHRARLEEELRSREPASRRRIAAAVRGELPLAALPTDDERQIANLLLNLGIRERAAAAAFGRSLLEEGHSVVAVNEHGEVVRFAPDGTTQRVTTR